jgi:hypothetical protein
MANACFYDCELSSKWSRDLEMFFRIGLSALRRDTPEAPHKDALRHTTLYMVFTCDRLK